jgi:hypothetical protein
MELPQSLWNHKLPNGASISEFVGRAEPAALPLTDIIAFTNVWQERLADATARNLPDLRHKAQKVLKFIDDHDASLTLLRWPCQKLGVLLEPISGDFLLFD